MSFSSCDSKRFLTGLENGQCSTDDYAELEPRRHGGPAASVLEAQRSVRDIPGAHTHILFGYVLLSVASLLSHS